MGAMIISSACQNYSKQIGNYFALNIGKPIVLAFTLPTFTTNLYLFRLTSGMMDAAIKDYNIESKEALIYHILQPTHR